MSLWTPEFLEIDAFGLDISDRSFKYAMLSKGNHGVEIVAFGKGEFSEGIIVAGEVKNEQKAADYLARAISAAKIPTNRVILALPEEKGFLPRIELPASTARLAEASAKRAGGPEGTDSDKIRSVLELHIEEHVPLAAEETIFDYERIGSREVIATVFPRAIVDRYMALARRVGLEVVALETEAHALLRVAVPREEKRPVMVIDLGETRAGFLIADEGIVVSTATKPIGGTTMIEAIERATGSSREEATRLFYEKGMRPDYQDTFSALMPLVSVLKDEIVKYIAFWQTHAHQNNASSNDEKGPFHIYLTGGVAHLEGLLEYLAHELRIPVSRAEPAENLFMLDEYIPPINRHDTLLWAIALGLAARNI